MQRSQGPVSETYLGADLAREKQARRKAGEGLVAPGPIYPGE